MVVENYDRYLFNKWDACRAKLRKQGPNSIYAIFDKDFKHFSDFQEWAFSIGYEPGLRIVRKDATKPFSKNKKDYALLTHDHIDNRYKNSEKYISNPLYQSWIRTRQRCRGKSSKAKREYYTLCPEWDASFDAFKEWSLANDYEEGKILYRKDTYKGFTPDNCCWVTKEEYKNYSRLGMKPSSLWTYKGEKKTFAEWQKELGFEGNRATYLYRYKKRCPNDPHNNDLEKLLYYGRPKFLFEYEGKGYTALELSEILGLTRQAIYMRFRNGMSPEEILNTSKFHSGQKSSSFHLVRDEKALRRLYYSFRQKWKNDPARYVAFYTEWRTVNLFLEWAYSAGFEETEKGLYFYLKDPDKPFSPDNCGFTDCINQVHGKATK